MRKKNTSGLPFLKHARRWAAIICAGFTVAVAQPAPGSTLEIFDAWWSNTSDKDQDGCFAPDQAGTGIRLAWDVDLFGAESTNVFEKVYLRDGGGTEWILFATTEAHTVSGNTTADAVWVELAPAPDCLQRDYRIEVYVVDGGTTPAAQRGPGEDSDLALHREEAYSQDYPPTKIYSTRWVGLADKDQDGCIAPESSANLLRLYWDADVVGTGALTVYERIYSRVVGTDKWNLRLTTEPHVIVGNSSADEQFVDLAPAAGCAPTEYKIELYHEGALVPDYIREGANDPNLAGRSEETFPQDTGPVIADAWWSNVADRSQDGCVAPAGAGTLLRLNWDPNVAGGGSLQVFEKIYSRAEGATNWTLLQTTPLHTIVGALSSDAQHLDVLPAGNCATNHYRIEVYRSDSTVADAVRDDANDPDLRNRREQTYAEDNAVAILRDAWWQDVADQDHDGCIAPGTNSYMRLVWDPDVSGNSSLAVFERIYWRNTGGSDWTLSTETTPHIITGVSSNDAQFLLISPGSGCATYDYRIEVLRLGNATPDHALDANSDADLASHTEELWAQDNLLATIADAWWSAGKDDDRDGCAAPLETDAPFLLNWNIDIVNGDTALVYERIYSRPAGTQEWSLVHMTDPREVQGVGTNDAFSLEIAPGAGCAATDYLIEVYRSGATGADASRGPATDPELAAHKKESMPEDIPAAAIASVWWSDTADQDGDGCLAPTNITGLIRLNWQPQLAGAGAILAYEKIYWRATAAAEWELIATNSVHEVSGETTNAPQSVALAPRGQCEPAEFRIEIYREGQPNPDATRDPGNEPALSGVKQESYTEDNVVAVVVDAWWSRMADADNDGCDAPDRPGVRPRLNWSMRLSGNGSQDVWELIWVKAWGETNWTALATNAVHRLADQVVTNLFVELAPVSGCVPRDFRIDVYRSGRETPSFTLDGTADPDLLARKQELYSEDNVVAVIANTWWSNTADTDKDGCVAPAALGQFLKLNWDADVVGSGTLVVVEKVYWKNSGATNWTLLHTGSPRSISGSTAGDVQDLGIDPKTGCALADYRIEIYRYGNDFPDHAKDSTNDSNLAQHKEESFTEDTQVTLATIGTNWWTAVIDNDQDGCLAPAVPNGYLRLNWDPDVAGSGTLTVFEKVYWRSAGSSAWALLVSTPPHTVTAGSSSDSQSADLFSGTGCSTNEYKIEIYRLGSITPDYTRDPAIDPSLRHREESYSEDAGLAPSILTQPASQTVAPGGTASFSVVAQGTGTLRYQWFFQATNMLPGAVESTLTLRKVQATEAGDYFVVVSNNAGAVTSAVARLTVGESMPTRLENPAVTPGGFQFSVTGPAGAVVVVEGSPDLTSWNVLATLTNTTGSDLFTDASVTNRARFYRTRQGP